MRLEQAFNLSIGLLVLTSVLAQGFIEGGLFPSFVLVVVILATLRNLVREEPLLSLTTYRVALLLVLAILWIDVGWVDSHPLLSLSRILLKVQVLKLVSPKGFRNETFLVMLALLQLGIAGLLLYQVDFFILLMAYATLVTTTLVLAHLREEQARWQPGTRPRIGLRQASMLSALCLFVCLTTAAMFLVLPRFGDGYTRFGMVDGHPSPTLNERIDLTRGGRIAESQRIVMRVAVTGEHQPAIPYFRAMVLDHYEQGRWQRYAVQGLTRYQPIEPGGPITLGWSDGGNTSTFEQTYYLEPSRSHYLFSAGVPTSIQLLAGISVPEVRRDDSDVLTLHGQRGKQVVVRVHSQQHQVIPTAQQQHWTRLSDRKAQQRLVQLPSELPGKRLKTLFDEICQQTGARTIVQQIRAVERYLQQPPFHYTLDIPEPNAADDPLLQFLFESKRGHCELYAGAMVILLRSAKIPARIVTGYLGKERNPVGDYIIVREAHAHAWVEALLPNGVWLPFDPTPAAVSATANSSWGSSWQAFSDYARMLWMTHVVSYDTQSQHHLVGMLRHWFDQQVGASPDTMGSSAPSTTAQPQPNPTRWYGLGWAALTAILIVVVLQWGHLRSRRLHLHPLARLGMAFERKLRRAGIARLKGETLCELAQRAAQQGHPEAPAWVAQYIPLRYRSAVETDTRQLDRLRAALGNSL